MGSNPSINIVASVKTENKQELFDKFPGECDPDSDAMWKEVGDYLITIDSDNNCGYDFVWVGDNELVVTSRWIGNNLSLDELIEAHKKLAEFMDEVKKTVGFEYKITFEATYG